MKKLGLLPRLLLGIFAGGLIGSFVGGLAEGSFRTFMIFIVRIFATFNGIFGNFLSFLIPLVIVSLITVGLADIGKKANKLFGFTLALAYLSSIGAGFSAFLVGKTVLPSVLSGVSINTEVAESVTVNPLFTIEMPVVFSIMSALILSFVLGLGLANIKNTTLLDGVKDLREIISMILGKVIIPLIPIHICGLFMRIAVEGELYETIKLFVVLYALILILQFIYIAVQFALSSAYTKKNFIQSIKIILPAYFTALGTQSSAATIPVSVECGYKGGSDKDIVDFAVPLCATIHLAGDTIALTLGAMGIMMINGMNVTAAEFVPYIMMLGVVMVAAPGIPGGGVMAALGLLTDMLSFTPGMQDLMITLHFSQDSFGTATNVSGDQALCHIINKFSHKANL